MISLIICTRSNDIPQQLRRNVDETIHAEHEWIVIDNSDNRFSIFTAYNMGVERAKGEVLCFMHDDIRFLTDGWGIIAAECAIKTNGIVGVIGNQMIPCKEASWWTSPFKAGHVYHHLPNSTRNEKMEYLPLFPGNGGKEEYPAVSIDGLWFCIPRTVMSQIRFDDNTFSGFHCYDSDICMQAITQGFPVTILTNIDIEHSSDGNLSPQFFEQRKRWFAKWKSHLPVSVGLDLTPHELQIINHMADDVNHWTEEASTAQHEVLRLRNTRAYRIGKYLLHTLSFFTRK